MVTEPAARVAQAPGGPLGLIGKVRGPGLRLSHGAAAAGTEAGLGVPTGLKKDKAQSVCD